MPLTNTLLSERKKYKLLSLVFLSTVFSLECVPSQVFSEAIVLVMCDPSMNELFMTQTGLCKDLYESRSLTAHSQKGCTQLKIQPLTTVIFVSNAKAYPNGSIYFIGSWDYYQIMEIARACQRLPLFAIRFHKR